MGNRLAEILINWYLVTLYLCLITGIYFFLQLPKAQQNSKKFWFPFIILVFVVFYESMGFFTRYHIPLNRYVNELLGNTEFPRYNLWVFNVANTIIATVLYLFLIKSWLPPTQKRILTWMIYGFIVTSLVFQFSSIEPLYLDQPMLFAIAANLILIACGIYFLQMISDPSFLRANPLRLLSFWKVTILLFTYSLTYIFSVSIIYVYNINPELSEFLVLLNRLMGILNQSVLILIIASPRLTHLFDQEPYS
ncbi:histidine kinase [Algoriphagus halophilus]|uniref:histidine kinase n=1 Tax=Algoriphagus halophilus TaxID=226505 RepID=UPI00358FA680